MQQSYNKTDWRTHSLITRTETVFVGVRPSGLSGDSDPTDWSPPPVWAHCFLSPGEPLAGQSDSPSASEPRETSGRPRCSSLSSHSMSCPEQLHFYTNIFSDLITIRYGSCHGCISRFQVDNFIFDKLLILSRNPYLIDLIFVWRLR